MILTIKSIRVIKEKLSNVDLIFAYLSVFIPILFYIVLPSELIHILMVTLLCSPIFYIVAICIHKNKLLKFLSVLNLTEYVVIVIPSFLVSVVGPLFVPCEYVIYFLFWEMYKY